MEDARHRMGLLALGPPELAEKRVQHVQTLRPLTVDQIRMLQIPNVVSAAALAEGRSLAGLAITHPRSMETVVPEYLEPFRPHGQFSSYRS